jgi:hypothetical protein
VASRCGSTPGRTASVAALGLFATSASEGTGKWSADFNEYFRDRIVHILPDRDKPGATHAEMVACNLTGVAREVRIVPLPGLDDKEDVADWIARGGTADRLREPGEAAPICGQQEARASTDVTSPGLEPTADVTPRGEVQWADINRETKRPTATCANARIAITALGIESRYDQFHDKLLVQGHIIGQLAGEFSDHACLVLRRLIHEAFKFDPGRNHTFDAAVQLCLQGVFDPIVEYLAGLQWDGTKRLDTWMTTYLGAEDTELNRAIGRLALVAMVRRARKPGCKFDQIIVLESPEGRLKSTALAILAGANENFSDQTILGLGDQQQQERLRGKWVYEIGDLSGIRKAEVAC